MPKIAINNGQLYYEVTGQGRPLVLISGLGQGAKFWSYLVPDLSQKFQVITFDTRGIGQSDNLDDRPYTVESLADDTIALLDALQLKRPHLVGHSLGAAIAFEIGRRQPDKTSKVMMISGLYPGPTAVLPTERVLDLLANHEGNPSDILGRGIGLATAPDFMGKQFNLFKSFVQTALNQIQLPHIYLHQSEAGTTYLATDKLEQDFELPLCLIYGEYDELAHVKNGERIKAKVPTAELHIIPDAAHLVPVEQPAAFLEIAHNFFDD